MNSRPILQRIKSKTRSEGDCFIFTGCDSDGYGQIHYEGRMYNVSRVIAHLFLGLDLKDSATMVLHKRECKSRACWNPEHLYLGDHTQNMRDRRFSRL